MKVIINSLAQHVWGLRGVSTAGLLGSLAAIPWASAPGSIATCLGGVATAGGPQFLGHCAPCWAALGFAALLTATFFPHKRAATAAA